MMIDPTKCWREGTQPDPLPTDEELAAHGALIGFQLVAVRFLNAWLPLDPIVKQRKPGAITYADKKTIFSEVNETLRAIGLSMIVGLDSGIRNSATLHSIKLDPFRFVISIAENPITNRSARGTNITASRAAELAMLCFSGARIGNGVASVTAFQTDGEEGALQTAEVTLQPSYLIPTPQELLVSSH